MRFSLSSESGHDTGYLLRSVARITSIHYLSLDGYDPTRMSMKRVENI